MGKMGNSRLKTHATRPYRKAVHTGHGTEQSTHLSHTRADRDTPHVRARTDGRWYATPRGAHRRTHHSSPHQFVNVTVCERNLLDATLSFSSSLTTTVSFTRHTPHARAAAPACARVVGEGEARLSARACARARCACTPRLSRPSRLCCLMHSRHSSDFPSPPSRSN